MAKQPVTVKLTAPIKFGTETITELVVQPPKGKHLRGLPAEMTPGAMLDLAGELTGRTQEEIDELDMGDAMRLSEAVDSFLPDPPKDSKT